MNSLNKNLSLLSTRTRNLFQPSPKEGIFYLHIPKCGGTSLNIALQECFLRWSLSDTCDIVNLDGPASWEAIETSTGNILAPDSADDYSVMKFREELLLYHMSQRHIRFISGHFPFSTAAYKAFSDKFAFITLLRNPVDRWISSYFYNRNRQSHRYRKIDIGIEDYLESDYGRSQGYEYTKFLAGIDVKGHFMTDQAVAKAKENLHSFRQVGFLEDMPEFKLRFEENFGRKLNIRILNQKPKSENPEILQTIEKSMPLIEDICRPDLEVYNYALDAFR